MHTNRDTPSLGQLLRPPTSFTRENYLAYLFEPFSRKLQRRVYLYTPDAFALWVLLESSPEILTFNERIVEFPIAIGDGAAKNASPRAISVDRQQTVTIHTFERDCLSPTEKGDLASVTSAWDDWARMRGFTHIAWTSEALRSNPVEFANRKRLLRFVSAPGAISNPPLERALLAALGAVRRLTFAKLIQLFPLSDPDEIQREVACLIIDQKIFSDIDRRPFSLITEVSAYHALETD